MTPLDLPVLCPKPLVTRPPEQELTTILVHLPRLRRVAGRQAFQSLGDRFQPAEKKALLNICRGLAAETPAPLHAEFLVEFRGGVSVERVRAVGEFEVRGEQARGAAADDGDGDVRGEGFGGKLLGDGQDVLLAVAAEEVADEDEEEALFAEARGAEEAAEWVGMAGGVVEGVVLETAELGLRGELFRVGGKGEEGVVGGAAFGQCGGGGGGGG